MRLLRILCLLGTVFIIGAASSSTAHADRCDIPGYGIALDMPDSWETTCFTATEIEERLEAEIAATSETNQPVRTLFRSINAADGSYFTLHDVKHGDDVEKFFALVMADFAEYTDQNDVEHAFPWEEMTQERHETTVRNDDGIDISTSERVVVINNYSKLDVAIFWMETENRVFGGFLRTVGKQNMVKKGAYFVNKNPIGEMIKTIQGAIGPITG